jgi:hypothetical protein
MGAYLTHAPPCMAAAFSVEVCKSCREAIQTCVSPAVCSFCSSLSRLCEASVVVVTSALPLQPLPYRIVAMVESLLCARYCPAPLRSHRRAATRPNHNEQRAPLACPAPQSQRILNGNGVNLSRIDVTCAVPLYKREAIRQQRRPSHPRPAAPEILSSCCLLNSMYGMDMRHGWGREGMVALFATGILLSKLRRRK